MRQQSKESAELEEDPDKPPPNWLAEVLASINAAHQSWTKGDVVKSPEEDNMERISNIIKTYRGVYDEDDENDNTKTAPLVEKPWFDVAMASVIVLNMLVIGLQIDNDDPNDPGWGWVLLEVVFMMIFVAEVVLKVRYEDVLPWYNKLRWIFKEPLNFLSAAIAFMAVLNLILRASVGSEGILRMLSLLRIIGLMRLVRLIRRYRALEELRLLIQGLRDSCQAIFWVVVIISLGLFVAGIICTWAIGRNREVYGAYKALSHGWDHEELFGTVGRSMYTLLQVMTLDSWSSKVVRHIITNQWWMSIFFLIFLIMSTHGVLNVIISVIVENVLTTAQNNRSKEEVKLKKKRKEELNTLREVFSLSDLDGSGDVTLEEFMEAIQDPEVQWRLRELDLPRSDAARLFGVIDGEGSRPLTMEEFIEGLTKLKGPALSRDLLAIQAQSDDLASKIEKLSDSLDDTERMIGMLDEVSIRIGRRFTSAVHGTREKIATQKVGLEPSVPPKRTMLGVRENVDLSIGNRPALPQFPNLLC